MMRRQQFAMPKPEKKKSSRWSSVLLDIWLLLGLVIGYNTHDHTTFIVICIVGTLLIITHVILASR